ncbi:MAG: uroporphyrinogen decarboxylase family protein [Chloroflexota bacterium]|nr:uroporphyrinogen decarboxylase family protein [Chloroflexota bacterium]
MVEYTIDIDFSPRRIDAGRKRIEAVQNFEIEDRVPVLLNVGPRYLLPKLGTGFRTFYDDPELHLYYQILSWQWTLENLEDDRLIEEELEVHPDFGEIITAGIFDEEHIVWEDDQPPYIIPWLGKARDVAHLKLPHISDNMGGRKLSYIEEMQFLVNKFHLRLQGEPILLRVGPGRQEGPFTAALNMAGDQIFDWIQEEPNAVHDLLAMTTEVYIEYQRTIRQLVEMEMEDVCIVSDGAEELSMDSYRDFVLPRALQIYEAFPGQRRLRMRGDITHLLELLVEEQEITHLETCSHEVDNEHLVEAMGGKVVVQGNVDPELMLRGTVEEVKEAAWEVLEAFADVGGLVLSDGCEVLPDTPVENVNALVHASEEFAEQNH